MYKEKKMVLALVFTVASCSNPKTGLEVESVKFDSNSPFIFSEKFELERKIPLETNTECLISEIISIALTDSIYILDATRQLFVFDNEGNFAGKIGTKGEGPEEYLHISDFYVNDSSVVIIDTRKERLITYDKSGRFLIDEKLPVSFMYIAKKDNINVGYLGNRGGDLARAKNDNYYRLLFYNTDYEVISGYSIFPSKSLGSVYDTGSPFYEYSDSFFIEPVNDTIYSIEGTTIKPVYVVDFGSHKRPNGFLKKTPAPDLYRTMTENDYVKSIINFYDFPDMIYFMALIGNQNNKHIFYDKRTKQSFITPEIIDPINTVKVKPYAYKGEKKYFLSIITPVDVLNNNDLKDESNPTLFLYKIINNQ